MPISQSQIQAAIVRQYAAARDTSPQIRLVAGPGTGKSYAIEERVRWLLESKTTAESIYVVSFTRAAARDLKTRIQDTCTASGVTGAERVSITTLHSLALRALRAAGLLTAYPVSPMVMDTWELENIFDKEFSKETTGVTPSRAGLVRRDHEAFWSTGLWYPPNYIPPDPQVSASERTAFSQFHGLRTQVYSCVLPGEVVRQCVTQMNAGTVDIATLLQMEYLIVDEYQDLNQCDIDLVDMLIARSVVTFVAGDDDQSIYSFRFGSPEGIQSFTNRHPAASHTLSDCFRCASNIVAAANDLIVNYALSNRIPKTLSSLYTDATPPVAGIVHRWRFNGAEIEARAIAESCQRLIASGMQSRDILILVSNVRQLVPPLLAAFNAATVGIDSPRTTGFIDGDAGRFVLSILRIVSDSEDYVAHRVLLGLPPGVGVGTCNQIANTVVSANLNYRDVFYAPLPTGVFSGRALSAVNKARTTCAQISQWQSTDTIQQRFDDTRALLLQIFGALAEQELVDYVGVLPEDMTVLELRNYLWADNDEQQARIMEAVYERLGLPAPDAGFLPQRVRMLTMHGAKGLSAKVVFVPGLEENIFPGSFRAPYAGLIAEAARLLYVSITRARATCVLSYATGRVIYGSYSQQAPSRFLASTAGPFLARQQGLSQGETQEVVAAIANL